MKRASIAVAVLVALTLTGCAGMPEAAPIEAQDAATTSAEETQATKETPEPAITAAPEPTGPEATYLVEVHKRTDVTTIAQATDEQLLAAGNMACDTFPSNPDIEALRLIDGEQPRDDGRYFDSVVIGTHAAMFLCPEYDPR